MDFTLYLDMMVRHKASDIFVTAGRKVRIKIDGRLRDVGETALMPTPAEDLGARIKL
jgi:twitching motility protein PilU